MSITSSGGDLAYEFMASEPEFFFQVKNSIGAKFMRSDGNSYHNIKHVLRAHVANSVIGKMNRKISKAGKFNIAAMVVNDEDNGLKNCTVTVQVQKLIELTVVFKTLPIFRQRQQSGFMNGLFRKIISLNYIPLFSNRTNYATQ